MTDNWREGLSHKDWLFDGGPIRGEYVIDRFNHLDWSKAWVDIGPSIAGNLGPYWHVPMDDGDTVHRLYPKVLAGKWLLVIRQACIDYAARQVERAAAQPQRAWQPIGTAPRDGTIIDLWLSGGGRVTDQWWDDEDKTWCGLEEEMFTHWAPLPDDSTLSRPDSETP